MMPGPTVEGRQGCGRLPENGWPGSGPVPIARASMEPMVHSSQDRDPRGPRDPRDPREHREDGQGRNPATSSPDASRRSTPSPGRWQRHRRTIGLAGAAIAVALAVVWTVVIPERAETATGWQALAIRWGHPLCWVLLAGAAVLFAVDGPPRLRNVLALAAAVSYAAFLAATLL